MAFCTRLLQDTGVGSAPGVDFDPVDGHRFMRFSFAASTPLVEEAIALMVPWFARPGRRRREGTGSASSSSLK
jgi:aspartate/methionine/tyrosine aminotransferase